MVVVSVEGDSLGLSNYPKADSAGIWHRDIKWLEEVLTRGLWTYIPSVPLGDKDMTFKIGDMFKAPRFKPLIVIQELKSDSVVLSYAGESSSAGYWHLNHNTIHNLISEGLWIRVDAPAPQCTCGATAVGSSNHSSWC